MSNEGSGAAPEQLQFDRAVPVDGAAHAATCASCGNAITASYYSLNGNTCCETCTPRLRNHYRAVSTAELARATGYGVAAAAAGTGIYYAVLAITGYEIGFIAVVVGLMVGKAVQHGGNARGGWKLQTIAMALTYASIVGSYVTLLMRSAENISVTPALLVVILLIPFLQGWQSILGLIIIGIGLFEAWKINRRPHLEISGPHEVRAA